jgi:hypothetical protein
MSLERQVARFVRGRPVQHYQSGQQHHGNDLERLQEWLRGENRTAEGPKEVVVST